MSTRNIRILIGVIAFGLAVLLGFLFAPRTSTPPNVPKPAKLAEPADAVDGAPAQDEIPESPDERQPFAEGLLLVGDPAPAISASHWFRGEATSLLQPGSVYLVDLWATWCGPCVAAMPHLSELQRTYADEGLRVLAVSIDEGRGARDQVENFLERRAEDIAFDVALDDGQTRAAWLDAAGISSIPTSFVVDREGTVVWIGNPNVPEGEFGEPVIDRVLREVMTGTYKLDEAVSAARESVQERRKAEQHQSRLQSLTDEMGALWSSGDIDGALEVIDQIVAFDAENARDLAIRKAEVLLGELYRPEEATAYFESLLYGPYYEDDDLLMRLATLFSGEIDPGEDGRLAAFTAASLVVQRRRTPDNLITLAGTEYAMGRKDDAVRTTMLARDMYSEGSFEYNYYDEYVRMYQSLSD